MKRTFLFLIFISAIQVGSIHGQNFDPINIPFEVDGELQVNALIGGLIAPQFSSFDLDGQGAEDLMVFDRNGNVLLPFINKSTPGNPDYEYAPEYTSQFPDLNSFVQFHDFNGDGKKDIFSGNPSFSAVEVWKNTSVGNDISFELVKFNFGGGNYLQIPAGSGFTNLYVSNIDVPAIIDVDGDGDLDFLTFEPGGSYMYYYKNYTKEMGLSDTLIYRLEDACWGRFFESGVGEEISLSSSPTLCSPGLQDDGKGDDAGLRHSGSTVLALDGDGDGDLDMILGDLSNNGLVYLENGGTSEVAHMISQNLKYPTAADEVDIFVHIAPFFIDIDNDGKRDLIASQNNNNGAQNVNHIWYYRNIGSDAAPIFELVEKDFLQNTSLIMGSSSHPTFLDYNADGLQDLLVGTHRKVFTSDSETKSLYLYENVGTKSLPSYKLVSNDYLGMSNIVGDFDGYLAPTVGDLDSDGDDDIVIGDKRGYLYYWENKAGANNPYEFDNFIYQYKDIKPGSNSKPAIYDLDGDGLNDLIVGEKTENTNPETGIFGSLNFYKNQGVVGEPEFNSQLDTLGNTNTLGYVFTRIQGFTSSAASPSFFTSNDELFLSVGSRSGDVFVFNEIEDNIYDYFNEVYSEMPILDVGLRSTAVYADLDDDNFYEVIVGNDNGGLRAFNTTFVVGDGSSVNNTEELNVNISPNPTNSILDINLADSTKAEYSIFDINGRLVTSGNLNGKFTRLTVSDFAHGVYMIEVRADTKSTVKRFVKI
ncbi:MAG: hypothetical protein ACJA1A_001363 [Saprospiraceae bacterium]|jgi:hypothetical protein